MSPFVAGGLLLVIGALAFVLYPILRPGRSPSQLTGESDELIERRHTLYRQIVELEFDVRIGKLDEADARELSDGLLQEAAELVPGEEGSRGDPAVEAEVEREIEAFRRARAAAREPGLGSAQFGLALVALVLGLLVASVGAGTVLAAGDGVIEGTVQNGTANGSRVAGLTVMLHIVGDADQVERRQTAIDSAGHYRFDGLDVSPSLKYLPVVELQGAAYFPRPLSLGDQPRQVGDITVYDATSGDQMVAFERSNLLVQGVAPNQLAVMEMGAVANVGDRTYLGADPPAGQDRQTLKFSTPSGAADIAPQVGFAPNDFRPATNGFTVASPVTPGRHQIAFSYVLPFATSQLELSKRLEYPTLAFNLYVPDVGLQIESSQLKPQGLTELGGQKYLLFAAQNLPPGTELKMRISGLPISGATTGPSLSGPILGGGSLALLAGLGAVYRRRRAGLIPANGVGGNESPLDAERLEDERDQLLLAMARLDDRYERGDLSPERYRLERDAGKLRLVALAERPGSPAGGG